MRARCPLRDVSDTPHAPISARSTAARSPSPPSPPVITYAPRARVTLCLDVLAAGKAGTTPLARNRGAQYALDALHACSSSAEGASNSCTRSTLAHLVTSVRCACRSVRSRLRTRVMPQTPPCAGSLANTPRVRTVYLGTLAPGELDVPASCWTRARTRWAPCNEGAEDRQSSKITMAICQEVRTVETLPLTPALPIVKSTHESDEEAFAGGIAHQHAVYS